jgi:dTDP-4-dehydrorhamnose 3,5-epimerase
MIKRDIGGVEERLLTFHTDNRGVLVELFRFDELSVVPEMAYLSVTQPLVVRGPHEHTQQTDVFVFLSNFDVHLWDNREWSATYSVYSSFRVETGTQLIVPPGVVHAYRNPSDKEVGYVFNAPDKLYMGWSKTEGIDEIRHESDPDSPFKVVIDE